ncbi:Udp-glycosyltransferase [Thalictrum thalictroides]|uniref:Glycosyltransferase n=1 Tax=Thalictrum thalictroides TaxID=46969 RepID=A0A7J6VYR4_THATH|nr:Udp-glycosyltransferase [Thalictrum thalictroides]
MSKSIELVFVPTFGVTHIVPTVEFAKRVVERDRDECFSITFLIIPAPSGLVPQAYIESITNSVNRIRFSILQQADLPPPGYEGIPFISVYTQNHLPQVKQAIANLVSDSKNNSSIRLVVDMFSSTMIDVADELGIPSYLYFTSCAASLGVLLHLPTLDSEIEGELLDYSRELNLPSYINPVPTLALPDIMLSRKSDGYKWYLYHGRRFRDTKGIIVNSVAELQSHAVHAFNHIFSDIPRVYLVGPSLDLQGNTQPESTSSHRIMRWLDDQPESSVIFLCFGSRGTLSAAQVREIAIGLERSGQRFVWSLRSPPKTKFEKPSDYSNPEEVLPDGFLQRVEGRGLMCGWAPQVKILSHKAIGGFVSHCGWNSVLESLWFGVPILTWPLDAEQKLNGFQLVKDLGLAVEVKDERDDLVVAEVIERGLRSIILEGGVGGGDEVRRKVKEMSRKCREAVMEGGSSWSTLGCLVEDLLLE